MPSNGRWLALKLMFGLSWRASAKWTVLCFIALPTVLGASTLFSYWVKVIVDSVADGDANGAVTAALALALSQSLAAAVAAFFARVSLRLQEGVGHELDLFAIRILLRPRSITHQLDPSFRDSFSSLEVNRPVFTGAIGVALRTATAAATAVATAALLATVSPWLLLIMPALLPSFVLAARGDSLRQAAEAECTSAVRSGNAWFRSATAAPSAIERLVTDSAEYMYGQYEMLVTAAARKQHTLAERLLARLLLADSLVVGMWTAVYVVTMHLVMAGRATIGDLVMTLAVSRRLQLDIRDLMLTRRAFSNTLHKFEILKGLEAHDPPSLLEGTVTRHAHEIKVRELSFKYPCGTEALRGVNTVFRRGERVAVVGPNGGGKSTLVKALLGLYGNVEDTGDPHSSVIFQDFARIPGSLRLNVGVGNVARLEDDNALVEALNRVGLVLRHNGLEAVPGRDYDLSGGEWQRLAAARSELVTAPTLRVYDEPTASLDALAEASFFEQLRRLARERPDEIVVWVTHRLSSAVFADRIIFMAGGAIIEDGTHQSLMASGGAYAALFTKQAEGYLD